MFDVNFEFEERDEFNSSFQINTYPQKTSELINDLNFADINYVDTAVGKIIIPSKLSELDNNVGYITLEEVPKVDTSNLATKQELNQKQDKGDYALKSEIPTQLSSLNNDVGYITLADIPDVDASDFATKEELNNKQDIINDLEAIRSNANLGATAIQPEDIPVTDIQVNGASVLSGGIANIPYASTSNWGVVKTVTSYGINTNSNGQLHIINPSDAQITNKSGFIAITCSTIDKALKNSITTNTIELTDDEKSSACNWIGAVKDVQANGTSVLVDGVANIPLATSNQAGLVRPVPANGIYVSSTGTLNLSKLSDASLPNKNSGYAVLVNQIDLATKVGVTTNTIELTDEEKANACNWLGATQDVKIQELSETDDITLTDNIIYNGGEQVSLAISLPNTTSVTFICNIEFTSGATATTLQYPDSIKWIGDDISDNIFTPASNKRYSVICYCNGIDYICVVKGV